MTSSDSPSYGIYGCISVRGYQSWLALHVVDLGLGTVCVISYVQWFRSVVVDESKAETMSVYTIFGGCACAEHDAMGSGSRLCGGLVRTYRRERRKLSHELYLSPSLS